MLPSRLIEAVNLHVHVDPRVDHAGVGDAELELVEENSLLDKFGQQLDLHRVLIADPKDTLLFRCFPGS